MRAIVVKELRENLRWLPVGVLIIGVFLWLVTPVSIKYGQISTENITSACGVGAALFAIALGALQSIFDLSDRQRGYLFHRSISGNAVMFGKVVAGAILYAFACAIPLTCLALWFAWMGPEYLPVRPAQLLPSVLMCVACFFLHPATLISVDRQARWFGTKLFPLVAVAAPLIMFLELTRGGGTMGWWFVTTVYVLLFAVVLIAIQPHHWSRKLLLVVGSVVTAIICVVFAVTCRESLKFQQAQPTYAQIGLDAAGQPWYYRGKQIREGNGYSYKQIALSGAPIRADQMPNLDAALPTNFEPHNFSYVVSNKTWQWRSRFASIDYSTQSHLKTFYYDNRGLALVYDRENEPPLTGVVSRAGFHALGEVPGAPFSLNAIAFGNQLSQPLANAGYDSLWADRDGVYQFSPESGAVTTLLNMPIDSGTGIVPIGGDAPQLLLSSGGNIHQFELVDESGETTWYDLDSPDRHYAITRSLPALKLQEVATFPAPPFSQSDFSSMAVTAEGKIVALDIANTAYATLDSNNASQWQVTHFVSPQQPVGPDAMLMAALLPIGLYLVFTSFFVVGNVMAGRAPLTQLDVSLPSADTLWVLIVVAIVAALALAMVTNWLCRRRGLGRGSVVLWTIATLILGLATPIAVVAIYPKLVCEPCPDCQRSRRIDRTKCPHCAAKWCSPPATGIELLEGQALVVGSNERRAVTAT